MNQIDSLPLIEGKADSFIMFLVRHMLVFKPISLPSQRGLAGRLAQYISNVASTLTTAKTPKASV